MDIVDAQLHNSLELGLDEMLAAMDALGIQSVLLDELWGRNENDHGTPCIEFEGGGYRPLSPYAQAAALRFPARFSFLQRVRRQDPQLSSLMALLGTSPGCRSVRVVVRDTLERQAFASGGYDELLKLAQLNQLPISVHGTDMGELLRDVAPRFPDLSFVIDHCGWIRTQAQWDDVLALAKHRNTWLKWSHAHRSFSRLGGEPGDAIQQALLQALDAFGPDRLLWAGDVTHEETHAPWGRLLSFMQDNAALSQSDKEWILGKTARRVFRWDNGAIGQPL